ncbi:MAG: hypothetical protein IPM14_04830 [bacterium]|nr:hypothetical protein [bacterium]
MNQIDELNGAIIKITMTIQERYPELYELLSEMPVTIPNIKNPTINLETLNSYYNSLRSLIETYNNNDHLLRL